MADLPSDECFWRVDPKQSQTSMATQAIIRNNLKKGLELLFDKLGSGQLLADCNPSYFAPAPDFVKRPKDRERRGSERRETDRQSGDSACYGGNHGRHESRHRMEAKHRLASPLILNRVDVQSTQDFIPDSN